MASSVNQSNLGFYVDDNLSGSFFGEKYFLQHNEPSHLPDNFSDLDIPFTSYVEYDTSFYDINYPNFIDNFPSRTNKPLTPEELELFLLNLNNHIQCLNKSLNSVYSNFKFEISILRVLKIIGLITEEHFNTYKSFYEVKV